MITPQLTEYMFQFFDREQQVSVGRTVDSDSRYAIQATAQSVLSDSRYTIQATDQAVLHDSRYIIRLSADFQN